MVILSMMLGSFSNVLGQDAIRFSETYKNREIMNLIDEGDKLFSLLNTDEVKAEDCKIGSCSESDTEEVWAYLQSQDFQSHLPEDLRFAWGWKSEGGKRSLYALRDSQKEAPDLEDLTSVNIKESSRKGNYDLMLSFSKKGAESWSEMTRENVGRNIAIVIEGEVVTAPMVQSEINMGKCIISGKISKEEAEDIKTLLET